LFVGDEWKLALAPWTEGVGGSALKSRKEGNTRFFCAIAMTFVDIKACIALFDGPDPASEDFWSERGLILPPENDNRWPRILIWASPGRFCIVHLIGLTPRSGFASIFVTVLATFSYTYWRVNPSIIHR